MCISNVSKTSDENSHPKKASELLMPIPWIWKARKPRTFQILDCLECSPWNSRETMIEGLEKVKQCTSLPFVDDRPLSGEIVASELFSKEILKLHRRKVGAG